MEEVEKFFKCPYCLEKISMLLDLSAEGEQIYIEDCEVCCNPIQIQFSAQDGKLRGFQFAKAYG
jgi:transcription elongation factor Elf1